MTQPLSVLRELPGQASGGGGWQTDRETNRKGDMWGHTAGAPNPEPWVREVFQKEVTLSRVPVRRVRC